MCKGVKKFMKDMTEVESMRVQRLPAVNAVSCTFYRIPITVQAGRLARH